MKRGDKSILVLTLVVFWSPVLLAQKPPSLEEQLRAQYEPGTALTVQKPSVFAVAPTSSKICPVKYQDSKLIPAEASCLGSLTSGTRVLAVGEKINPSQIDVDLAKERISFRIVECDACNKGVQSASFKSQIDFQFAKGFLEQAGVPQVVDTISEVLAFQDVEPPPPPRGPGDSSDGAQPDGALTNNDVIKMARVKLGDGIIISKIKSSQCNFDMTVDGMVQLKTAGVSDAVIQAMQEAQASAAGAPSAVPTSEKQPVSDDYVLSNTAGVTIGSLRFSGMTEEQIAAYVAEHDPGVAYQPGDAPTSNPAPQQQSFSVRHRHRYMDQNYKIVDYYCSGTLSASPDGTVTYDCDQTEDPTSRCEHLSFAPGTLKQAKVGGGKLHLASKQGNFDLYGNADDLQHAQTAIAPFVQTAHK